MSLDPDPERIADPTSTNPEAAALGYAALQAGAGAASPRNSAAALEVVQSSAVLATDERDTYEESKHRQILGFRRWLVPSLFALTVAWLIFVGLIIKVEEHRHVLSDAVLIALLGTATANVLGLLVIVLKSLFPVELDRSGE